MEKIGEDLQSERMKSQTAIRCAKAAILLSSIRNATKTPAAGDALLQKEEHTENLMIELAKEKRKLKKWRHLIMISLLFHFIILLVYPIFLCFL